MQKSNLPEGLRTLQKWYTSKTLRFDLPIQRAAGQWSPLQKSLLVHSLLAVIRQIKRCRFHQIKTGLSEHLTMG